MGVRMGMGTAGLVYREREWCGGRLHTMSIHGGRYAQSSTPRHRGTTQIRFRLLYTFCLLFESGTISGFFLELTIY